MTRPQVELKNLNSFRAVQESVDFEIVRQAKCVQPIRCIRLWAVLANRAIALRLDVGGMKSTDAHLSWVKFAPTQMFGVHGRRIDLAHWS